MRAGYISIIGFPNVGKSTLLNRFLSLKLSIVSRKPQTTRSRILGILTEGDCQAVFIDTPGLIDPKYELHTVMLNEIKSAVSTADLILWLTDIDVDLNQERRYRDRLNLHNPVLAINKIDRVKEKENLLPRIEFYRQSGFDDIFLISALTGEGVEDLKKTILKNLPEGPFFFPEDQLTEQPERFFVSELIREQVFENYGEEIPYATFVVVEEFKEREKGKIYIRAVVYVEKDSQKGIIIGRKGEGLKKIGIKARQAIEEFLSREVFLDLWVKVKKNWRSRREIISSLMRGEM